MKSRTMWDWLIELYGEENLKKMPLRDVLEIAWFFYINPINEKRIKEVFIRNNMESDFKEIPI